VSNQVEHVRDNAMWSVSTQQCVSQKRLRTSIKRGRHL